MWWQPPLPEALGSAPTPLQAASRARDKPRPPDSLPLGPDRDLLTGRGGGSTRWRAEAQGEVLPGQRAGKMAAPMELPCWSGAGGCRVADLDSLAVLVRYGALCCALEDWGRGPD